MKKLITTASLLALMAAGPAFAQTPPSSPDQNKPSTTEPAPGSSTNAPGAQGGTPGMQGQGSDSSAKAPSASTEKMASPSPSLGQGEIRVSKLIGSSVRNSANESIGNVNDVLLTKDGQIESVVVGVGGFLGLGEKNVALQFSELKFDTSDANSPKVTASATSDALAAAPEWKAPGSQSSSGTTR